MQNSLNEQHGFRALRERDLATAQARFEDVLRQTPNDTNALVGLGFVRMGLKKFDQALVSFNRARELAPDRADAKEGYDTARFWLAMQRGAGLQASQPDAALAAYEEAAALRPGNEQPLLAIAQLMQRRGNIAGAQAKFEQVVKTSPNNVDALVGLGFVRLNQKAFDAAGSRLRARRRWIRSARKSRKALARRGSGASCSGAPRHSPRIGTTRQSRATRKRSRSTLARRMPSLVSPKRTRRKGNRAESLDAYRQLATGYPADPRGWLGLIRVAIESNDSRSALETVQSIPQSTRSQLDAHPEYLARLAQALYVTNQAAEGNRVLRTALDVASRSDSD